MVDTYAIKLTRRQRWLIDPRYSRLSRWCVNELYITTNKFINMLYEEASLKEELACAPPDSASIPRLTSKLNRVLARKRAYEDKLRPYIQKNTKGI